MYIHDFHAYYQEIIYLLELKGEVKEGTYRDLTTVETPAEKLKKLFNFKK